MAIKVPDNFRPSDYGVEISIPKPDMECRKNEDGSFSLYAVYTCDISDSVREAAREIYEKMEADLIDELLRLNGYVPERTCTRERTEQYEFGIYDYLSCGHVSMRQCSEATRYCAHCGAKVVK